LIKTYGALDERFVKMVHFLKVWNKSNFPDEKKRLPNYALTLMAIVFL
jgi:hypothetical protein